MADSKAAQAKPLLTAEETPKSYTEAYKTVITADSTGQSHAEGRIYADEVKKILATTGLSADQQAAITQLVLPAQGKESSSSSKGLTEVEFYDLLALIALAQEGEQVKWEVVNERRNCEYIYPFNSFVPLWPLVNLLALPCPALPWLVSVMIG